MPAIALDRPPPPSEALWASLRAHILRERQKKKQEQEADAEVERQRKERERQQNQDKMTLGETREQIAQLELRLKQLKDEKHQLFLDLKKVLNEDDNRRRQSTKESSEVMEVYSNNSGYPGVSMSSNPQLSVAELQPMPLRNPLYKVPPQHTLIPAGTLKRRRSPSPSNYPQYGSYKPAIQQTAFQKVEDSRRGHEYVRAVLWNKPYGLAETSQYGPFYTTATTISYSNPSMDPGRSYVWPRPAEQTESSSQATQPRHSYMPQQQQRPLNPYGKPAFSEENFYSSAQIRPSTHVSLHGGTIPIQQPPQGVKTGGITSGYPIRPSSSAPTATTPHSVYVTQPTSGTRLVYSQPGSSQPTGISSIRYSVPPMQREA